MDYLKEMVLIVLVLSQTQLSSSSAMRKLLSMFPSKFTVAFINFIANSHSLHLLILYSNFLNVHFLPPFC